MAKHWNSPENILRRVAIGGGVGECIGEIGFETASLALPWSLCGETRGVGRGFLYPGLS